MLGGLDSWILDAMLFARILNNFHDFLDLHRFFKELVTGGATRVFGLHERVFGLHETIRANTGPNREQHGKNTWPTRKQHRPTQVPTQGLREVEAMCQQAGVGPTRNRCHGKKTPTDRNTNVVRTTYPLSVVAVVRLSFEDNGSHGTQTKHTHMGTGKQNETHDVGI